MWGIGSRYIPGRRGDSYSGIIIVCRIVDRCRTEELVRRTEGYSGADVTNVCREAAMMGLRKRMAKARQEGIPLAKMQALKDEVDVPVMQSDFLEAVRNVCKSVGSVWVGCGPGGLIWLSSQEKRLRRWGTLLTNPLWAWTCLGIDGLEGARIEGGVRLGGTTRVSAEDDCPSPSREDPACCNPTSPPRLSSSPHWTKPAAAARGRRLLAAHEVGCSEGLNRRARVVGIMIAYTSCNLVRHGPAHVRGRGGG